MLRAALCASCHSTGPLRDAAPLSAVQAVQHLRASDWSCSCKEVRLTRCPRRAGDGRQDGQPGRTACVGWTSVRYEDEHEDESPSSHRSYENTRTLAHGLKGQVERASALCCVGRLDTNGRGAIAPPCGLFWGLPTNAVKCPLFAGLQSPFPPCVCRRQGTGNRRRSMMAKGKRTNRVAF